MINWTIKVLNIIACVLSGPLTREKWSMYKSISSGSDLSG
jgi:hypothetical protein